MVNDKAVTGTILIVEDDAGILELESQRLGSLGLPISHTSTPEEAIALMRSTSPALTLLDFSLPGMTALELIDKLKSESVDIPPFIMVTGHGDEKVAVQAMQAGALDYIVKDAAFLDNLLPTARRALEKAELISSLQKAEYSRRKNLRLYNFLAQVNQAAVRLKDRGKLFAEICGIAVSAGGFKMAWIGLPDTDIGRITPAYQAGFTDGYLDGVKISIAEGETPKGPAATAFASGQIIKVPDITADPIMAPWRDRALKRGYKSAAAIPLSENGRTLAVLSLYSDEVNFFTDNEQMLLAEIQGDVSLALDGISLDEKRAASQAALQRTSAELAHVMETTQVVLFRLRVSGRRLIPEWLSGDTLAMVGYDAAEMLTPGWFEKAIHPEDRLLAEFPAGTVFEKGILVRDYRVIHKNGSTVWVHEQLKPYGHDSGHLIGSWTDVTDMLQARARMELLTHAIHQSSDEIYVYDAASFKSLFCNLGAQNNLGYSRSELESMTPWEVQRGFTPELFKKTVGQLLTGEKENLRFETRNTRKDGSSYPVEARLQFIRDARPPVFLAVINDISERRRNEVMLSEMETMQRVESLGQLAGGIAHDFNNMLTGIMANISLLERRCTGDRENVEILKETMEATRNAQSLTTNLLAFSKGGKPVKKELSLEKCLRDIFSLATRGASAAGELAVPENLWSISGDESQLKQAINNLLLNGLQAMPSGGALRLTAENIPPDAPRPDTLPAGHFVRLTVQDTGIGIPREYLRHIFEPYFSTKKKGHGLGLSMAWSVIKNHGGHISAESVPGKGTAFEIYLPSTGRRLAPEKEARPEIYKGSGRILVLEDEEVVIGALRRMLRELGYDCEAVGDGRDALRRYDDEFKAGKPFDAVIMDLTIPGGMGGKEAVARLRALYPNARVVVSSGYSEDGALSDHGKNGFDAVLPKPYKFEELAGTLHELLADGSQDAIP